MTIWRDPVPSTPRKGFTKAQRAAVWAAGNGLCEICDFPIDPEKPFDVDHRIEIAISGKHEPSNWRALHPECHREKTSERAKVLAHVKRLIKKADPATRPLAIRRILSRGFNKPAGYVHTWAKRKFR